MFGFQKIYKVLSFFTILILISCVSENGNSIKQKNNDSNSNQSFTFLNKTDKIFETDPVSSVKSEDIKGRILPNIDDTTLLRLIYGSFRYLESKRKYCHSIGPHEYDKNDSIYMEVENCIGDNSSKIIYLRGNITFSSETHSAYNETALLLDKTENGWMVMDSYIDNKPFDYMGVEFKGIFNNKLLIEYSTGGLYNGGRMYLKHEYELVSRDKFNKTSIGFIIQSNNEMHPQCQCETENYESLYCYKQVGDVKYSYNDLFKCLVFDYKLLDTSANCNWKNKKAKLAYQQWYMNADTAFQSKGNQISEWADHIDDEKISLTDIEIKKRLGLKK